MVENAVFAEERLVNDEGYDTDTSNGESADALRRAPFVLITSPTKIAISL